MIKLAVIFLYLLIALNGCCANNNGVETINALDADGSFHFKSSQNGNFVEIHGFIETENGESYLRMNGTYIFQNYGVRFSVNRNEYKTEPFDRFA